MYILQRTEEGDHLKEFESKAEKVLTALQTSVAAVLGEFGDPFLTSPADISEIMELDINIAWKVSKLANSPDLFSIGKFFPGCEDIDVFCRQATLLKCSQQNIHSLKEASAHLEKLINEYASTREETELLLSTLSLKERSEETILDRKKAFTGNRNTFGLQSDVQLSSIILMPAESGKDMMDLCRIKGHIGLLLSRPDVSWRISSTNIMDSEGKLTSNPGRLPLFSQADGEPPLIKKFCSENLPRFGTSTTRSGRINYYLDIDESEISDPFNLFTAEVLRDTGRLYRQCPDDGAALNNTSRIPTKHIALEVYIPLKFGSIPIEVEMWSRLFGSDDMTEMIPGDLLPIDEEPVIYSLERGFIPIPQIPEYSKLMKACFSKLGINPQDFRLARLTMDFPPIPTSIDILIGLPEKAV